MSVQPVLLNAHTDREAWLAARRETITATDIAAILGEHPWKTPMGVYLDKVGEAKEVEETEPMYWGNKLEAEIAEFYSKTRNVALEPGSFVRHSTEPLFGATPDFLEGNDSILECKVAGEGASKHFGEPGTDQVPTHYLCQVMWQMLCTGRKRAKLAVLLASLKVNVYVFRYDEELARQMMFEARKFWGEYVAPKMPPPLTGRRPDSEYLKEKFPIDNGQIVAATNDIEDLIAELGWLRKELAVKETRKEQLENLIKEFMGEAAILTSLEGTFTWKTNSIRRIDSKRLRAENPVVADEYTKASLERRFLTPWRSDNA